jgi:hypothetical protein
MKKVILTLVLGMMGMGIFSLSAQLSDEEYAYITMGFARYP